MSGDEELHKRIEEYARIAKENKDVDVASLMIAALDQQPQNMLTTKMRRWAYLISIGAPPLGLFFALYFYFSGKDDGKRTAWICIILTVVASALVWVFFKMFLSTAGVSVNQFQQLPSEYQQLLQ